MLPPKTLRTLAAMIGAICTVLMGIVQFGILYYLPLYYEVCGRRQLSLMCSANTIQVSKGYSPLISGVALVCQA